MNDNSTKMKQEITRRLNDNEWDRRIAHAVIGRRKQKITRYVYGVSLSSLAAAASLILVLTTVIDSGKSSLRYGSFISQQVNGTHGTVFAAASSSVNNSPEDDILSIQSIDVMIDDTLAMR